MHLKFKDAERHTPLDVMGDEFNQPHLATNRTEIVEFQGRVLTP